MGMRINGQLPTPEEIKSALPMSPYLKKIKAGRDGELKDIFTGKDSRFIVVVGPCSADNIDSVLEYVRRLAEVNQKVKDRLFIIPRVYTNKPRTTGEGYKGMLHQPEPDKAPNLHEGILAIRQMHLKVIAESGLTSADEMLYPENRSYLDDVLSYEAVGARSVENQQHRLVASGMDIPVGMKNPTSGDFTVMMCGPDAMYAHLDKELAAMGLPARRIKKEPNCVGDRDVAPAEYKLTVHIGFDTVEIKANAAETLLVAMERAGLKVPSKCRAGGCGYCHSKLVSGEFTIAGADKRRLADSKFGYIHPCCTYPDSDMELIVPRG